MLEYVSKFCANKFCHNSNLLSDNPISVPRTEILNYLLDMPGLIYVRVKILSPDA